jgi:hypothetical protein
LVVDIAAGIVVAVNATGNNQVRLSRFSETGALSFSAVQLPEWRK